MDKNADDIFDRLQRTVDLWAEEITDARTVLTERLDTEIKTDTPVFRLIDPPVIHRPPAGEQRLKQAFTLDASPDRSLEALEARIRGLEARSQESIRERKLLEAELLFAREHLQLQITAVEEAEQQGADFQTRAKSEIADLLEQARAKDWNLLKARNELDLIRSERARGVEVPSPPSPQLGALQDELEDTRRLEADAAVALEEACERITGLEQELEESYEAIARLTTEMESLQRTLAETSGKLLEAREELSTRTDAEVDESPQTEELTAAIAEKTKRLVDSEAKIAEMEVLLARQKETNEAFRSELAEQREISEALQEELSEQTALNETLRADLAARLDPDEMLREKLTEEQEKSVTLRGELAHERKSSQSLRDERAKLQRASDNLLGEAASEREAKDLLQDELTNQRKANGALREELDGRQEKDTTLEAEVEAQLELTKSFQAELASERDRSMSLQEEMQQQTELIESLRDELSQKDELAASFQEEIGKRTETTGMLWGQLGMARAEVADKSRELDIAQERFAAMKIEYKHALGFRTQLSNELDRLQDRVMERDQAMEEAHDRTASLLKLVGKESAGGTETLDAGERFELLSETLEAREAALEKAQRQIAELEKSNGEWRSLRTDIDAFHAQVLEREEEVMAAQRELEKALSGVRNAISAPTGEMGDVLAADQPGALSEDQSLLVRAMKQELGSLREVAKEKDFVLHHAQEQTESLTRRDAERETVLHRAADSTRRLKSEASTAADGRKKLKEHLEDLRERLEDKDATLRSLQRELLNLQRNTPGMQGLNSPSEALQGHESAPNDSDAQENTLKRFWGRLKKMRNDL